MGVIQSYMPTPLSDEELEGLIKEAIISSGAEAVKDMGKVVAVLKPQVQGRADMGAVSQKIKALLA